MDLQVLVYGKCECFVFQMLYVCVLCASCGSSQCCSLHDLQFVNAGRGCKRRPYGRGILQSWYRNCLIGSHECLLLFTQPVAVSAFMICRGLCACTEMLWMCVLYVSFGSKVRLQLLRGGIWACMRYPCLCLCWVLG